MNTPPIEIVGKPNSKNVLPSEVEELRRKIEHWRTTREKLGPMPQELWDSAINLAREHGVAPIAGAINISHNSLKRRLLPTKKKSKSSKYNSDKFVELNMGQGNDSSWPTPCIVELQNSDGAKMIIRLPSLNAHEVEVLAKSFWRQGL